MASASDMETIELSEAIKTILNDGNTPECKNNSTVCTTTPRSRKAKSSKSPKTLSARYSVGQNTTPSSRKGSDTPLSRKSSILQRSFGYDSDGSSSQRKRRHAQEVIILRPPKKRAGGSTPRVTSTTKLTPSCQSTPNSTSMKPSRIISSTPVSSTSRLAINPLSQIVKCDETGATDTRFVTPKRVGLVGDEKLSPKEREDLALQARYLRMMEQQGLAMAGVEAAGGRLQEDMGLGEQIGPGGLSLNIADQTSRISLVARGNQDDSLTNITWLRRMSAPDLDPVTLQHIKSQDPHKERPPYSYSALIQFAISSAPEGKLTLRDIYFWIETHFPYFRTAKLGWKNSIRHNLSLHKIFVREAPSGPGQPAFWTLRPGTVVRLPERKVIVHEQMGGPTVMPECYASEGTVDMAAMANLQMQVDPSMNHMTGNNILVGDPNGIPMFPVQGGSMMKRAPILSSTPVLQRPNIKGSKRVPRILPKGTPPYALVPLPIYFTTDPKTGQLVPANGDNLPPGSDMTSPSLSATSRSKKPRNIVPKFELPTPENSTPLTRMEQSNGGFGRVALDSGYGSTDSSLGDDGKASVLRHSRSMKNMAQAKYTGEKENSLSAEFGLGLDVDNDLLKTPPKTVCPEWLSPIRGFSPVPDSGFSIKDMDFNFTPFKTGFTPNNRVGHSNTPRHLMLSPVNKNIPSSSVGVRSSRKARLMTPKRCVESKDSGLLNSSFEKMFGDVNFDMDPDNIDVGNMSWLLNSPPPVK